MKIRVQWLWYDFWIGAFFDRGELVLYVCPLPTVVIKVWFDDFPPSWLYGQWLRWHQHDWGPDHLRPRDLYECQHRWCHALIAIDTAASE